jgi:multiple sugar transport system permease protein
MQERRSVNAWCFLAFPLGVIAVFVAAPTLIGIVLSFFEWSGSGAPHFIGLRNYQELLHASAFRPALRNTLIFTVATVPLTVILAFLFATVLNAPWFLGRTLLRTVFFLPTIISIVAIGFIWRWVLDPSPGGLFNHLLISLGASREVLPDWLGNSGWGLTTIIVVSIWRGLGFSIVLYLAALTSVPRSLYDAAAVDGAGGWQTLWNVTWPGVRPMTVFLMITGTITALQVFDIVLLMIGKAQQDGTDVLNLYLYREFTANRLGFAAAIGVVVLLMTVVITVAQAWSLRTGKQGGRA